MPNAEQGYQTIGNPANNLLARLRKGKDSPSSKSSMKSTSSEIISATELMTRLSKSIGIELSETGVQSLMLTAARDFQTQRGEEAAARELFSRLKASEKLPYGVSKWGKILLTRLHDPNEHGRKSLRIAALLSHFPTQEQSPEVAEMIAEDYQTAVDHIPAYAVDGAAKRLLSQERKKRPTPGELVEACEPYYFRYRELTDFLKRLKAYWQE